MISFSCKCGKKHETPEEYAGRKITCNKCDREIKVPCSDKEDLPVILEEGGLPKSFICLFVVIGLLVISTVLWLFIFRDTWEIDNYSELSNLIDETKRLYLSEEYQTGIEKYDTLLELVGERTLKREELVSSFSETSDKYELLKKKIIEERRIAKERKLAEEARRAEKARRAAEARRARAARRAVEEKLSARIEQQKQAVPFYEIVQVLEDNRGKIITHIYVYTTSHSKEAFLRIGKDVRRKLSFTNYKILFYNDRQKTPRQKGFMTDEQMKCWMGNFRTNEKDGSYKPYVVMTD